MDISIMLYLVGIFGTIIGILGALAMVEMINRSSECISRNSEHPPDKKKEKGGEGNGHSH